MGRNRKRWLLVAAVILCMMGKGYAATPLYDDCLRGGLATLEQNNQEAEMLLSFDSAPGTEDSWIIFSFSGSGCILSACAFSGCLGSGCGGTGCFGSGCVTSGCIFSGCAGSVCGGSVCGGSGCLGSVCGISVCGGSYCAFSICGGTACKGSICNGSGCQLSLCNTTGCGASACATGYCTAQGPQVEPGYMLASAQLDNGRLSICANFSGRYNVVYVDKDSGLKTMTLDLNAGIVSTTDLANAKELQQVVKAA
jgi:hypothetical protein